MQIIMKKIKQRELINRAQKMQQVRLMLGGKTLEGKDN